MKGNVPPFADTRSWCAVGQDTPECAELNKIYAETMCVTLYIYLFSFAY